MKKILIFLFIFVGALSLTACDEHDPYDLNRELPFESVAIDYQYSQKLAYSKTVLVPDGVQSYDIVETEDSYALIITMDDGTMKLSKEDFTILTSGEVISHEHKDYFLVTISIDSIPNYGLFDFKSGEFLISLETTMS